MSRGPSMTALLGLLAVAGYQNRDKLAEMFSGAFSKSPGAPAQGGAGIAAGGQQSSLDGLLGSLGAGGVGGLLSGGLNDLVESFKQTGQGEVADSWISKGPNQAVAPQQLEQAIGPDILATLSEQTGLSREELLSRLSRNLPDAVDKYTPEGRLPPGSELSPS